MNLPCILESQKTLNQTLYKIADISQLMIISENVEEEGLPIQQDNPHGISTPLRFTRKRRFRKRLPPPKNISERVMKLLQRDAESEDVEFTLVDRSEYENM